MSLSDRAGHLARTQAACANIDSAGSSVYDRLDLLNIRLPSPVRTSVRVRDLDAELNILAAEFAFSHL